MIDELVKVAKSNGSNASVRSRLAPQIKTLPRSPQKAPA